MVDRVDALEVTVRKLQAAVFNNSEITAHKSVVSSRCVKDKEKPSEEKFGQQGEDLTSPFVLQPKVGLPSKGLTLHFGNWNKS